MTAQKDRNDQISKLAEKANLLNMKVAYLLSPEPGDGCLADDNKTKAIKDQIAEYDKLISKVKEVMTK